MLRTVAYSSIWQYSIVQQSSIVLAAEIYTIYYYGTVLTILLQRLQCYYYTLLQLQPFEYGGIVYYSIMLLYDIVYIHVVMVGIAGKVEADVLVVLDKYTCTNTTTMQLQQYFLVAVVCQYFQLSSSYKQSQSQYIHIYIYIQRLFYILMAACILHKTYHLESKKDFHTDNRYNHCVRMPSPFGCNGRSPL